MANITIPKALFDGSVPMPKVCIACGKPAISRTTIKTKLETGAPVASGTDTSGIGCLFVLLDLFSLVSSVAARESRLCLNVPVCRYHGWVAPANVTIESDNADTVELSGVSSGFIAQLPADVRPAGFDATDQERASTFSLGSFILWALILFFIVMGAMSIAKFISEM